MASGQTEHYGLNQWEANDQVRREEFNADNLKIDTLLKKLVPTGCIMFWSGSMEDIPEGWALCDGNNGTPDLRDRFVVGAGGDYAVGDTGGESIETLTSFNESSGSLMDHINAYDATTHDNRPPYYALCCIMKL